MNAFGPVCPSDGKMLFMGDFSRDPGAPSVRYSPKGEFVTRTIAGETILVPVRGRMGDLDAIFNLNETASFIWNLIDGRTTFGDIVAAVSSEFDVEPETADADARQFIAALEEAGLIAPVGGA